MQFLIILLLLIIMDLTRPVPKPPRRPGLGEFTAPTAEQDRRIPVFWGSPYLVSPNLVWYGHLRTTKIKQKIKGLFKDKEAVVGYRYYLGMHLVFGYGGQDTRLREIWIGGTNGASGADKVWSGNLGEGADKIKKLSLWGGDEEGGGISGGFNFFPGGPSQGRSDYLIKQLGSKVPSYRGVCGIVWNGVVFYEACRFHRAAAGADHVLCAVQPFAGRGTVWDPTVEIWKRPSPYYAGIKIPPLCRMEYLPIWQGGGIDFYAVRVFYFFATALR